MEEILMKHGYISQNENEWTKNYWTVRIDSIAIEVFNNPDKEAGKYFIGLREKVDLEEILQEIDEYLIRD